MKSLWGNVSLLRGCLRHLATPINTFCPHNWKIYMGLRMNIVEFVLEKGNAHISTSFYFIMKGVLWYDRRE